MWDDPSVQVRFVRFLCGMAAPAIVLSQFALNKVIAHFSNSHREMASLKDIRIDFSYKSRHRSAGGVRVGVLASCSDHSLAIDALSVRSPVRPTELPHIRAALTSTPD